VRIAEFHGDSVSDYRVIAISPSAAAGKLSVTLELAASNRQSARAFPFNRSSRGLVRTPKNVTRIEVHHGLYRAWGVEKFNFRVSGRESHANCIRRKSPR
jgi:hypothetical protein